jgi:hypothetical protein
MADVTTDYAGCYGAGSLIDWEASTLPTELRLHFSVFCRVFQRANIVNSVRHSTTFLKGKKMDDYCKLRALLAAILTAGWNAQPAYANSDSNVRGGLQQADMLLEDCGFVHPDLTIPIQAEETGRA